MKSVTKFSCIVYRRSHAVCRLLAVALIFSLCGLSMTGMSYAEPVIDTVNAGVSSERVVMSTAADFDEIVTMSEFAMIMAEAGFDISLISGGDPFLCLLCLLTNPKNQEVCEVYCEDQ